MKKHLLANLLSAGLLLSTVATAVPATQHHSQATQHHPQVTQHHPQQHTTVARRRGSASRSVGTGALGGAAVGGLIGGRRGVLMGGGMGAGVGAMRHRRRRTR